MLDEDGIAVDGKDSLGPKGVQSRYGPAVPPTGRRTAVHTFRPVPESLGLLPWVPDQAGFVLQSMIGNVITNVFV